MLQDSRVNALFAHHFAARACLSVWVVLASSGCGELIWTGNTGHETGLGSDESATVNATVANDSWIPGGGQSWTASATSTGDTGVHPVTTGGVTTAVTTTDGSETAAASSNATDSTRTGDASASDTELETASTTEWSADTAVSTDTENVSTDTAADGDAGETSTTTGTTTGSDEDKYCQDRDEDKFGDPDECDYFSDRDDVPSGWVNDWTDCDDSDDRTHVGAAEDELEDECTKDADDDGWADNDPPGSRGDIVPGSDCNDRDGRSFPGAAKNEDDAAGCFKDSDQDGWGDDDPPTGVTPGRDCDDDDEDTFPGSASNEADADGCFKDSDQDDWGDDDPDDPNITPGSDCDDDDKSVGECMTEPVIIRLEDNTTIKAGDSVELNPTAMGGSGNYRWKWFDYANMVKGSAKALDDDEIRTPAATPARTTSYLVRAEDRDDPDNFDEVQTIVYVENVGGGLDRCVNYDLRPRWVEGLGILEEPQWEVTAEGDRVCQTTNNQPAAFICPEIVSNVEMSAVFNTKGATDDDWIGFVWGMQGDATTMSARQYYLFSWRRESGEDHIGCDDSGTKGMFVRRIDEQEGGNLTDCDQLVGEQISDSSVILVTPEQWNGAGARATKGWSEAFDYRLELEYRRTGSKLSIFELDGSAETRIALYEFTDTKFPEGRAGFFTTSQFDVCFQEFTLNGLSN